MTLKSIFFLVIAGDEVNWVQCDTCELWFHLLCIGLGEDEVSENEDYVCFSCVQNKKKAQEDLHVKTEPASPIQEEEAMDTTPALKNVSDGEQIVEKTVTLTETGIVIEKPSGSTLVKLLKEKPIAQNGEKEKQTVVIEKEIIWDGKGSQSVESGNQSQESIENGAEEETTVKLQSIIKDFAPRGDTVETVGSEQESPNGVCDEKDEQQEKMEVQTENGA